MTFINITFQESSPLISYSFEQWGESIKKFSARDQAIIGGNSPISCPKRATGGLVPRLRNIVNPALDLSAPKYSLGSAEVTQKAGTTATVTFEGTGITIFGAKRTNHGNYSVSLDNGPLFIGNGNEDNIFQVPLWSAHNLVNTLHTVIITNIPTSQGNWLDLDFVTVGREIGPPGYAGSISNMTLDDQSSLIEYNGSWSSLYSTNALNNSLHQSNESGSSLSLFFHGSSVELYGLYVNAPFQVTLDDQLPRNVAQTNVNATQSDPQTLLFYADGLNENQTHVVTLTNTVSNFQNPLYFDYAIVRGSQAFFEVNPRSSYASAGPLPSLRFPVGSIIGSVIGSLGGLIILVFIGFIVLRHSRNHYRSTAPARTAENNPHGYVNGDMAPQAFLFPSITTHTTHPRPKLLHSFPRQNPDLRVTIQPTDPEPQHEEIPSQSTPDSRHHTILVDCPEIPPRSLPITDQMTEKLIYHPR